MNAVAREPIRLADYRPPAFRIETVELTFDLVPERTVVASRLTLARQQAGADLELDGEDLELLSIALDGAALGPDRYRVDGHKLIVAGLGDRATLDIVTAIDPAANTRLEGLYVSSGNFCTQCEAEGFRRITYFLDRPDVMATYKVTMKADRAKFPVLLSNGNLVEQADLGDGRHMAVWQDPFPKPCYLFALVAGDLARVADRFTTASGRDVALNIYVEHGKERYCAYAMDSLKRSMRWDEDVYGLEYDLDIFNIVAVSDFNMGAMENKSLNVFNDRYILADPETATDIDYAGIESVVAHEYFHNWTGNRVTCRDWFQLSLKEGLTVFRDQQFSGDMRSRPVKRIGDVRALRARQFPEDAGPLCHPVRPEAYIEINNFYTATVYEKGAEVIGMMHRLLGPEGYRAGIDLYFKRHDGQAVTTDDFAQAMQDAGGVDLGQFRLWYSQAGTPMVEASWKHEGDELVLNLAQSRRHVPGERPSQPMDIPLAVGIVGPDGGDVVPERLLRLDAPTREFRFKGVPAGAVPSINRGFSAPILLKAAYSEPERAFLMAGDPDPFNRWEAGNQYATQLILERVAAAQAGKPAPSAAAFVAAFGRNLADETLDDAFRAYLLALPSEEYIAEQMAVVDVDAIHAARRSLRLELANTHLAALRELYDRLRSNAAFSPDAASAGRRALRNAALTYLAVADDMAARGLPARQFADADNMTDRMAALTMLVERGGDEASEALAAFYARFERYPLVVDKWFALQAASPAADTLDRVRALMRHPAFSMRNPNKVRSLIGAFANANQLRFHSADGSGYRFLAEQVIALDQTNPQIAARLLTPLGPWKRHDAGRQAAMKAALETILAQPKLSPDVYEIASRSLAG
ncbi:MAG: aminopeptidase N [Alphaproteobacteria bacterium]|jgi:aminopeptidase N|nr:aminopeptidase N [Alphaproteobacteria bacterium]